MPSAECPSSSMHRESSNTDFSVAFNLNILIHVLKFIRGPGRVPPTESGNDISDLRIVMPVPLEACGALWMVWASSSFC